MVTFSRGLQGLAICSVVFVFIGTLSFQPAVQTDQSGDIQMNSSSTFLGCLLKVLICTTNSMVLSVFLLF